MAEAPVSGNKTKLLVIDLDGTLLRTDKSVSAYTVSVLRRAQETGVVIAFVSGRTDFMMALYTEPYLPCDYHISFNGAAVKRTGAADFIYSQGLEPEAEKLVWQYLADHMPVYTAYTGDHMYFRDDLGLTILPRQRKYLELAASQGAVLELDYTELFPGEIRKGGTEPLLKFVVYEDDPGQLERFQAFIESVEAVVTESTGYGLTGIFDRSVSKERAVRNLQRALGITQAETCAFGDFDNDLSMFQAAGIRVAVSNASDAVKEQADVVCLSNDEDGVAMFIENYLL